MPKLPAEGNNRCINLRGEHYIVFIFSREKTRSVRAAKSGKLFLRAETTELRNQTTRSLGRNIPFTKQRSRMKTKPKFEHVARNKFLASSRFTI